MSMLQALAGIIEFGSDYVCLGSSIVYNLCSNRQLRVAALPAGEGCQRKWDRTV